MTTLSTVERQTKAPVNEFAEFVQRAADGELLGVFHYDGLKSDFASFLAEHLQSLASEIWSLSVHSPKEYLDRLAVLEACRDGRLRDEGAWDARLGRLGTDLRAIRSGLAEVRRELPPLAEDDAALGEGFPQGIQHGGAL